MRREFARTNFCRPLCLVQASVVCVSRETQIVCLCGRRDLHSAVVSTTLALGRHFWVIREKEVDDAALRGVHRGQLHGPALADSPTGRSMCHALYRFHATLTVPLRIKHDPLKERPLLERRNIDQVLEGVDSLTLLPYKQSRVVGRDIGGDKSSRVVDLYAGFEAHSVQDRGHEFPYLVQQLLWSFDLFGP